MPVALAFQDPIAPGQSRLIRVGTRIVTEIDIIVISVCGSKPLSSKTRCYSSILILAHSALNIKG